MYCRCKPVPDQLLAEGLFPCAPTAPTLAVDLKLLEFARLQFLTMVPNLTGWCEAMELHLKGLSFKFVAKVSHVSLYMPTFRAEPILGQSASQI